MVVRVVEASIRFGSPYDLEVMSMQMKWVLACIVIIEYDLDNLAVFKDESVGVATINCRIHSGVASGESRVQGRDLGCDVCYVVEEGANGYSVWLHHGLLKI